jgi:lysozyme
MNGILPTDIPRMTREQAERVAMARGVASLPVLIGIRGYYLRTMGDPTKNDRGIYDDAIALLTPNSFATYNANTDPSRSRPATADRKGMAVLLPGLYRYRLGIHGLSRPKSQQYEALVQAGPVTVDRDGGKAETGMFGINIHRGGETGTSSEGCQTIPPNQWDLFLRSIRGAIGRGVIPYLLITVQEFNFIVNPKKA